MENISKAEFDEIGAKYPLAYQHFHTWIDSYKASVNYNEMFGDFGKPILHIKGEVKDFDNSQVGHIIQVSNCDYEIVKLHSVPKVHELPFEMQFGILAKFMIEILQDNHLLLQLDKDIFKRLLKKVFHILNTRLTILEERQELDLKNNR